MVLHECSMIYYLIPITAFVAYEMFRCTNRILKVLLIIRGFNLLDLWVKCQGHVSVLTIRQEAEKTRLLGY